MIWAKFVLRIFVSLPPFSGLTAMLSEFEFPGAFPVLNLQSYYLFPEIIFVCLYHNWCLQQSGLTLYFSD